MSCNLFYLFNSIFTLLNVVVYFDLSISSIINITKLCTRSISIFSNESEDSLTNWRSLSDVKLSVSINNGTRGYSKSDASSSNGSKNCIGSNDWTIDSLLSSLSSLFLSYMNIYAFRVGKNLQITYPVSMITSLRCCASYMARLHHYLELSNTWSLLYVA